MISNKLSKTEKQVGIMAILDRILTLKFLTILRNFWGRINIEVATKHIHYYSRIVGHIAP